MKRIILISSLVALTTAVGCEKEDAKPAAKTADAKDAKKKAGDKGEKEPDVKDPAAAKDPAAEDPKDEPDPAADSSDDADASTLADMLAAMDPELMGYDPRVAQAAMVAKGIEAKPEDADTVLAQAKLDRDGLDALMYEIASDPDLTSQYRIARGI